MRYLVVVVIVSLAYGLLTAALWRGGRRRGLGTKHLLVTDAMLSLLFAGGVFALFRAGIRDDVSTPLMIVGVAAAVSVGAAIRRRGVTASRDDVPRR